MLYGRRAAAGDTSPAVCTGWPQGLVWPQASVILAEGFQGLLYGLERWFGQLPLAVFATLASIAVEDGASLKGQVSRFEAQHFSAPPAREG